MELFKMIWGIFPNKQQRRLVILFFKIIIGCALETLGVSLILPIIALAINPEEIYTNQYFRYAMDVLKIEHESTLVIVMILLLIVLYILKNIYLTYMVKSQSAFTYSNQVKIANRLLDSYIRKPYEYFLNSNTAEIVRTLTSDIEGTFLLVMALINLCTEAMMILLLIAVLCVVNFTITVVVAVIFLLLFFCIAKGIRPASRAGGRNSRVYNADMIKMINQVIMGIKEVKISNGKDYFLNEYEAKAKLFAREKRKQATYSRIPNFLIESVTMIAMLLALMAILLQGSALAAMLPQLATFAYAAIRLMPSVGKVSNYYNIIVFRFPALKNVYENLEVMEKENEPKEDRQSGGDLRFEKTIKLENMTYAYANMEGLLFENINLTLHKGESIGIIGESGAGKTTLVDVMLGILKPIEGKVLVDDVDIEQCIEEWYKEIGYIPQMANLLDATIRENIAFAVPAEQIDDAQIQRVMKEVQLDQFVQSLPQKDNTVIGERGVRLSGGQRQRISIARALYHDPEVLIFDEATSALDNETEQAVMEAIDLLKGKRTIIIIAHRLTTLKNCDIILEVADGSVKKVEKNKLLIDISLPTQSVEG